VTPEFWSIIEAFQDENGSRAVLADQIEAHLVAQGVEATLRFSDAFDSAMDHLYTWDLWGAAYLAMGGCGDDMFEYFRAWLISAGQVTVDLAGTQPELSMRILLNGSDDPEARWEGLRLADGELVLHAAGSAHEKLTGGWLPPRSTPSASEPRGVPWDEEDLPHLFPDLANELPPDWWGTPGEASDRAVVLLRAREGLDAQASGDHTQASLKLEPLLDGVAAWAMVDDLGGTWAVDVAYAVGINRLLDGNVSGAASALRLVSHRLDDHPHIRRASAQIELAVGDLDRASRLIDPGADAHRLDRTLSAKLALRRGDPEEALRRARAELAAGVEEGEHPWDVARSYQQVGQIFVELEEADDAELAMQATELLLGGAPDDLPLVSHLYLLVLGVMRLRGHLSLAIERADYLSRSVRGSDLAECLRERARSLRADGRLEEAEVSYRQSAEAFTDAGEVWEERRTRLEAEHPRG
jgi:tetratricopeptide (TPR) repeat protein